MITRTIQLSAVALACVLLAACGPNGEDSSDGYWLDDFDCERLERETFEDCTYDRLNLDGDLTQFEQQQQEVRDFCASPCNKVGGISASFVTSMTDVKLVRGVEETEYGFGLEGGELTTLAGTEQLQQVGSNFSVVGTTELESISSLSSLATVGGTFQVSGPNKLRTLDGLQKLESVNQLVIRDNPELRSLEALESLETVRSLAIADNPKLPTCEAENLVDRLGLSSDEYTILGNGTGSCDN